MKIVYSILFSLFLSVAAKAQKVYFIYLQSDNGSPFYVKMDDKIHSSSGAYLILPGLTDSNYLVMVGYPGNQTDSRFQVTIKGKDRGFLIKNFDDGLGLFDLQALTVIRSQKEEWRKNSSYQVRTDDFTRLLAKAANDTSLLYELIVLKPEVTEKKNEEEVKVKDEESQDTGTKVAGSVITMDTTAVVSIKPPVEPEPSRDTTVSSVVAKIGDTVLIKENVDSMVADQTLTDSLATAQQQEAISKETEVAHEPEKIFQRSAVKKYSESSTSEGFGLVFFDKTSEGIDTIRLLIPNPRFNLKTDTQEVEKVVDRSVAEPVQKEITPLETEKKVPKNTCTAIAGNNDFLKLRKNMASEVTDESMVDEARKYFRSKCFSTEQIKNLSTLFLTSAGKYQFFDAAYRYITDPDKFPALASEISDAYYLKRFKALVGE